MADVGNPYKALPIFVGKYQLQLASNVTMTNPYVMLTNANIVCFMSDMVVSNLTANQVIATLPADCRPASEVQVAYFHNTTTRRLIIGANGEIKCSQSATSNSSTMHTNGLMFNVNGKYY